MSLREKRDQDFMDRFCVQPELAYVLSQMGLTSGSVMLRHLFPVDKRDAILQIPAWTLEELISLFEDYPSDLVSDVVISSDCCTQLSSELSKRIISLIQEGYYCVIAGRIKIVVESGEDTALDEDCDDSSATKVNQEKHEEKKEQEVSDTETHD
jgi:hypothetical protein